VTDLGPAKHRGEDAYKLEVKTYLEFSMVGIEQKFETVETRVYGSDGALVWLSVDVPQPMGQLMQFVGEVVNGKFRVTKKIANQEQSLLIEPPGETLRDALEEAAMINDDTKVGDSHESCIYEPILKMEEALQARSVVTGMEETVYNGVPTRVFQIETTILDTGLVSASRVTAEGELLEQRVGGFTMRLEDEALAKDVKYAVDLVSASRPSNPEAPDFIKEWVSWGAGIRASQNLVLGPLVKERFGGRLKFFVCGGAPLSSEIAEFLCALGLLVLRGQPPWRPAPFRPLLRRSPSPPLATPLLRSPRRLALGAARAGRAPRRAPGAPPADGRGPRRQPAAARPARRPQPS